MAALLLYMIAGLLLAQMLFAEKKITVRCWLGLVFGCTAMMWLPCLAAFAFGFTKTAQLAALVFCGVLSAALLVLLKIRSPGVLKKPHAPDFSRSDAVGAGASLAAAAFCGYLLYTHVLLPADDGSLWTGQSTYGDLAMHLGFIESLYRQGTFPPEYSIYPGQPLNYPFLVDAASAGLRFFGLSLRMSVIAPSIVMLFCVFWGFWNLADMLTGRLAPTLMSWLMFTGNGGFGFLLFLGKYRFSEIFTGFYTTPTNLTTEDIRWSNVICDMLIPQRATMAGWCLILPAIFLLITAIDKTLSGGGRKEILVLAVLAGAMPMIHTHSFLALGILSAAWFFGTLPAARRRGRTTLLVKNYVLYGAVCLLLAAPQFFRWTAHSVAGGNLLQWHAGWVAGANGVIKNWLVFYIVNVGVVFIAAWPMLPSLRDEALTLFIGAAAIFVTANLVVFQPNLYDNNKLLYIWFMLTDILVCDWLWCIIETAPHRVLRSALAGILVFLGTFSGALTMLREAVSEYQLFSSAQTEAAGFIIENTEPDSIFLTGTEHTNPVAVLAGRNIVCGSSLYLYFHGVDYSEREAQLAVMYEGGDAFERLSDELNIDYVYIGPHEFADYHVNYDWFSQNCSLVYEENGISIFQVDHDE